MGLFKSELCEACGAKVRIRGKRIQDKKIICNKCVKKLFRIPSPQTNAKCHEGYSFKTMTKESYKALLALKQDNDNILMLFKPTRVFANKLFINEHTRKMVVGNASQLLSGKEFKNEAAINRASLMFDLNKCVYWKIIDFARKKSELSSSTTSDGTTQSSVRINLLMCFDDSLCDMFYTNIGERTVSTGDLQTKKESKIVEELSAFLNTVINNTPSTEQVAIALKKARTRGYISESLLKDELLAMCAGDKKMVKEIRKKYDI